MKREFVIVIALFLVTASSAALAATATFGVDSGRPMVQPVLFREHGPMTIDFEGNTIVIGEDASDAGIETWLPFGDSAPLLDIPVRIGDLVIAGHFDTGNPGVLSVPASYQETLPLSGPVQSIGRARTADAEFEIRGAPLDASARTGDAEIPLRQVVLTELPVANLGTSGLRGLVLHIDWDGERFGLTGIADPISGPRRMVQKTSPGRGPAFGMMAAPHPDGSIEISGTVPGSTAEALGLLAGDRIIAVNGTPTRELDPGQIGTELVNPDLALTVERDDDTPTLKLRD